MDRTPSFSTNHVPRRSQRGALLTSGKCPPAGGSCELPLGLLYTAFAEDNDGETTTSMPTISSPTLCGTCLAYANLYNTVTNQGDRWQCALCGADNVLVTDTTSDSSSSRTAGNANSIQQPTHMPAAPVYEFRQQVVEVKPSDATTNTNNSSPANATSLPPPTSTTTIILAVDANLPPADLHAIGRAVRQLNDCDNTQWALLVYDEAVSVYQLGLDSANYYGATNGYPQENHPSWAVTADVLTDHRDLTTELGQQQAYLCDYNNGDVVDRIQLCLAAVAAGRENGALNNGHVDTTASAQSTTASDVQPLSRLERLKRAKAARQQSRGSSPATSETTTTSTPISPWAASQAAATRDAPAWRCTGEALQVALDLATSANYSSCSRIWVFSNGCPNLGDGSVVSERDDNDQTLNTTVDPLTLARAVGFYNLLGEAAREEGCTLDVFLTGVAELGLAAWQALVAPSAGYALVHERFTTPHLPHHLRYLWEATYRPASAEISVDIRHSTFLTPTHFCGPGTLVDDADKTLTEPDRPLFAQAAATAAEAGFPTNHWPSRDALETTMTRLHVGRVDPLSTYSMLFALNDFFQKDAYAVFQCVTRHLNRAGTHWIVRVATHRLPVAKDTGEFLDAVDEEVVPVVLAKEAVYRSLHGRESEETNDATSTTTSEEELEQLAHQTQLDLDATVARISHAYRLLALQEGQRGMDLTEEGGVRAAGSSLDFAFPPELGGALKRLYHFRRGPLLSPGPMRSTDDRMQLRSLFLRFPLEESLLSMSPSLWLVTDPEAPIRPVPAETLALWDSAVIAADNFHSLFIWSGRRALGRDDLIEYAREVLGPRVIHRFPMPEVHVLTDGDSMSRRFTALLSPSHGDPLEHSVANFPGLSSFTPDELAALQSKFQFYDATTDPSFRSWFWTISSATSKSKDEGWSLCE